MFKAPFSFNGRIRRTEYGLSALIYYALIFTRVFAAELNPEMAALFLLVFIPLFWFIIAQGAKRCHDLGNSGVYQIIPFYGLWMLFAGSDYGVNQYGPNPKGQGNIEGIEEIGQHLMS